MNNVWTLQSLFAFKTTTLIYTSARRARAENWRARVLKIHVVRYIAFIELETCKF